MIAIENHTIEIIPINQAKHRESYLAQLYLTLDYNGHHHC